MRRKLMSQFLVNYIGLFLLTITVTALSFVLLSIASGVISKNLIKNQYPARAIMADDVWQIRAEPIVKHGGGIQVVDKNYQVVRSEGINNLGKGQLDIGEFTNFLVRSKSKEVRYHYDILYNSQGQFWLIVTFPSSLRIDFAVVSNQEAASEDWAMARFVIVFVGVVYLILIAVVAYIYARITAFGIITPLRKLSEGTKLLREGDYSVRVALGLKNEFSELEDTFNAMAAKIEDEMDLRRKSESDRQQMILDISHDLKNPLASVSGYAELCLAKPDLTSERRNSYLQAILRNSERANLMLNDLFELAKLDNPGFMLQGVNLDLCEYLRQFCADLIPVLEKAGFSYSFQVPEESIQVRIDPAQFSRILHNLSDNAVRHNPQGTTVRICLYTDGELALIQFKDDGLGIPAHLLQDIFNPFVRADRSRNSETGGSGLGLSIARKIALAHGGDLHLHSGEQQGTTFILSLPLV